jgi:glycine/D-amino acid oxidase-like deaminating enzyme
MGTSTAFFLASETDLDVTLLEKGAIGSGSTGDSSAILRHHYGPQERYSRMAWWSHRFYRAFEEETGEPIAHEDNRLVRFGEEGTTAGEYAAAGHEVLSSLDIPTSRFERDAFDGEFPMVRAEEYDFAVTDETAGYADGADAAGGFARAATASGTTVVTGVEVRDVLVEGGEGGEGGEENGEGEGDAVTGVETTAGTVTCEQVVSLAGPWTPRIAGQVGVEVPLVRTREQVVLLDPPEEYAAKYPALIPTSAPPGADWYLRPDFGGGVLVATHHTGEEIDPAVGDTTPDEKTLLELIERVSEFVPELRDAGVKGQYCGVYSTTPDHDFVLDRPGPAGFQLGCGFSGHGFKHGPAIGKIMADLVSRGETDLVDLDFFSLDRFDGNPDGHGLPEDAV